MGLIFSKRSELNLQHVRPDLVRVLRRALGLGIMDFSVVEGLRADERQQHLFATGKSKTMKSKHLMQDDGFAHAVDAVPYPIDWKDTGRFYILNGIIRTCAVLENVPIRTGADWDRDGLIQDQSFHDLPHYELVDYYI